MPTNDALSGIIAPVVADAGYRLVRLQVTGARNRTTLQVMAEPMHRGVMGVDDCARLSRLLSTVLEDTDPIRGAYDLEVSSPGIDRPLVAFDDFAYYAGHEAKIEVAVAIDGQRRFRGRLLGVEGDKVRLQLDVRDGSLIAELPFVDIVKAKLVLTDELIAASRERRIE